MNIIKKGHTTILKDINNNVILFLETILKEFASFENQNLILDLSNDSTITVNDLINFKSLAKSQKTAKKSLVIVTELIEFDDAPEYLNICPTIVEAHDLIEMEEIERDLGF